MHIVFVSFEKNFNFFLETKLSSIFVTIFCDIDVGSRFKNNISIYWTWNIKIVFSKTESSIE